MYARILVLLFLTACAPHVETPTIPTRAPVAWVPEARALLGHVEDDALADFDAELERVRAIARFEIETADPDHPGFRRLLALHARDLARAADEPQLAAARARALASTEVLVAALPLAGSLAFEAILDLAPSALVSHPDPVLRFLQSSARRWGSRCRAPAGFYLDPLTETLSCPFAADPRVAPYFRNARGDVRVWLRLRGVVPPTDALSAAEARAMVEASYFPSQAFLGRALARGALDDAVLLATALLARDPSNIPARLTLLLRDEVARGVFPGDPDTIARILRPFGPAELAHRLEGSDVAKLVLLETLARRRLTEDYDFIRNALPTASLERLGPVLAWLDMLARPTVLALPEDTALGLGASDSPFLRAYSLEALAETRMRNGAEQDSLPLEAVLALDVPRWFPVQRDDYAAAPALVERMLERLDGPMRARARRLVECLAAGGTSIDACERVPRRVESLEEIDLDTRTLDALESTRFWDAEALNEMLERVEGTGASARPAYVRLRVRALLYRGELDEAERRLATDGRVLSHADQLWLAATLLDLRAGARPETERPQLVPLRGLIATAFARGCPPDAGTPIETAREDEVLTRTLSTALRAAPTPSAERLAMLDALIPRFRGRARQVLAHYVALGALMRGDRAPFDRTLRDGDLDERSSFVLWLNAIATDPSNPARALPAASRGVEGFDHGDTEARTDTDEAGASPRVPEGEPDALPDSLLRLYLAYAETWDARAADRFLAARTADANARRVQCEVAIRMFERAGPSHAVFGVPLERRAAKLLDQVERLCVVDVSAGEVRDDAIALLERFSLEPPARLHARAPRGAPSSDDDATLSRMPAVEAALGTSPPNYVLLRLAGLSRPLTLALEHREADARRATAGNPSEQARLTALLDDLRARRIDEQAAMLAITVSALPEDHEQYLRPLAMLDGLLQRFPRSKTLAWAAAATRSSYVLSEGFFSRRGDLLIGLAGEDPHLLRALARALDDGRPTLAARALARAQEIDPGGGREQTPENCDPP